MARHRFARWGWALGAAVTISGGIALASVRAPASAAGESEEAGHVASHSATEFTVDPVHSTVMFRNKHLDVAYFYGRFNTVSGSFQLDPEHPGAGSIKVEVDVTSVDSNNAGRDKHLKSPDFFNAAQFPIASFSSSRIARIDESTYAVSGPLTINGTTREITATLEHTGENTVARFGHRAGVEATLTIKRSDFGITFMPELLGDAVRLTISLEGVDK